METGAHGCPEISFSTLFSDAVTIGEGKTSLDQ
jgi:hypothetical protein